MNRLFAKDGNETVEIIGFADETTVIVRDSDGIEYEIESTDLYEIKSLANI